MDNNDCCPTTEGGDSTITNGDECRPLEDCVLIPTRVQGGQDGDFH